MVGKKEPSKDNRPEQKVGSNLPPDSIRVLAESVGIAALPDDAANLLAEQVTYLLKTITQDALKGMRHGRRRKLSSEDIDHVLQSKNVEPLFGMTPKDPVPFRLASGGGREVYFPEDRDVDLSDVINSQLPKVPPPISLKAHWLSIDGVQPAIAENPPPASREQQKKEILEINPKSGLDKGVKFNKGEVASRKRKMNDTVKLKELLPHLLSSEHQQFFKETTESLVGSDEIKRTQALQSLTNDPGLSQLMPYLVHFVTTGVYTNVAQHNLAILIYLMRTAKALLDNTTLFHEKYLHQLLPAVMSCMMCEQLCSRPESDNHWALRDFAARLIAFICKNFNTTINNIQGRVVNQYTQSFEDSKRTLSALYGALAGLGELGPEVTRTLMPQVLRQLGERMRHAAENQYAHNLDRIACDSIKKLLAKHMPSILKTSGVPETDGDYERVYGYLGPWLLTLLPKQVTTSLLSGATTTQRPTLQIQPGRASQQFVIQQPSTPLTPSASAFFPASTPLTPRTPVTPSVPGGSTQQKLLIVTSQARAGVAGSEAGLVSSSPAIVQLVSAANASVAGTAASVQSNGGGQKIVVIKQEVPHQQTTTLGQQSTPGSGVTTTLLPTTLAAGAAVTPVGQVPDIGGVKTIIHSNVKMEEK